MADVKWSDWATVEPADLAAVQMVGLYNGDNVRLPAQYVVEVSTDPDNLLTNETDGRPHLATSAFQDGGPVLPAPAGYPEGFVWFLTED